MTLAEFKAWFEGYSEGIEEKPIAKQWTRIKARVAEIDGATVTERIYVDRYRPVYPYPYYPYISWTSTSASPQATWGATGASSAASNQQPFNSLTAMNALGMADAAIDLN